MACDASAAQAKAYGQPPRLSFLTTLESPSLGHLPVLRGVHVEKTLLRKAGCCQFALFDYPDGHAGKRRIDLELPCPQSLLSDSGEVASIDGTERLQPPAAARHGNDGIAGFTGGRRKEKR